MMRRALRLARRGYPAPNPYVGAVVVREGRIVGEGYHSYAGGSHAEPLALAEAGEAAKGATLYVTLEPCAHHGRTPPCADAIVAAGISRVVVAQSDPNPVVQGRGIERLRAEGIEVYIGLLADEATRLNEQYHHFHRTGRPFVVIKAAMTMDGKIAAVGGESKWITSSSSRSAARRMRAECGAVLVGYRTAYLDDPELTARTTGVSPPPLRVVLDRELSLPLSHRVFDVSSAPTVVFCGVDNARTLRELTKRGVQVEVCEWAADGPALGPILNRLGVFGVTGLLVEGGGETIASFIEHGLVDKVAFFYAPSIAGGRAAPTSVGGRGIRRVADFVRFERTTIRRFGSDWLVVGYPVKETPV